MLTATRQESGKSEPAGSAACGVPSDCVGTTTLCEVNDVLDAVPSKLNKYTKPFVQ